MAYFIGISGRVYKEGSTKPPFPLEERGIQNWFLTKMMACSVRDILEEWEPTIFYGKD